MNIQDAAPFAIGMIFIGVGFYINHNYKSFAKSSREAEALVLEVEIVKGAKNRITYFPTVQFRTHEGQEIVVRLREFQAIEKGQKVIVSYLASNPEEATVGRASDLAKTGRGALILCVIFGLGLCLLGVGFMLGWFGKTSAD